MKVRLVVPILSVQLFLCSVHWFLFFTWTHFWRPLPPAASFPLGVVLAILSVSFMAAAVLGYRFSNWLVRAGYLLACVWLGLLNFLFFGALLAWLVDIALRFLTPGATHTALRPYLAITLIAASVAAAGYGFLNARFIRQQRVSVKLPNLPPSWRGRSALVISDIHLGHINRMGFARRITAMARDLDPAIIFIVGDLFDGTPADPAELAAPLFELRPPFGVYFIGGNHEEFGDARHYEDAVRGAGMRVLDNDRVDVDGLQIVGVAYRSTYPLQLRAYLEGLRLVGGPASILLNHVPNRLPIAEHAGVSLQISGHTHGGQVFPFSLITKRAFGKFAYGLQRFGNMQVFTSSGAGTWGPPMRVGTHPEIVLLTFE